MTTTSSRPAAEDASTPKSGLLSQVAGALIILVGAGLITITLINSLFQVGPAFEDLTDDFRPVMTQQSIDTARADVAGLGAVQEEFTTKLAPALSEQLQMTPEEFDGFVAEQFPDVAAGMGALPTVVPTFNGLIDTLDEQRPLFASADAIPTKSLPATTVPWVFLLAGILALVVGLLVLRAPRTGGKVAVIVGLLALAVPLVLSLPAKAGDADQMNANLSPVYNQELVDNATGALEVLGAMGAEMQTAMLPALAEQLKMSPEEMAAFLGDNFPATAQALQTLPGAMERFTGLVTVFDENLDNYETLEPVAMEQLIWILMVGGGLVAGFGVLAVATGRRD